MSAISFAASLKIRGIMLKEMVDNWSMYDYEKGKSIWGPEHIRRNILWHKLMKDRQNKLLEWCIKKGIITDTDTEKIPFALSDAVSRICSIKALRNIYPESASSITQATLDCHYDMTIGPLKNEAKLKLNDSDQFSTDDISMSKKDYLDGIADEVITTIINWDGVVRAYWLKDGIPKGYWDKPSSTVLDGDNDNKRTEGRIYFNREDAIWTTTITMPDEWNTTEC